MVTDNFIKVKDEELRTDRLYYLSHPLTSYGDEKKNRANATVIEARLLYLKKIHCINPVILPLGKTDEEAMRKCRILYDACDAIIMCPGWEKSIGCRQEFMWAVVDNKPIYLYRGGELYRYGANKSS